MSESVVYTAASLGEASATVTEVTLPPAEQVSYLTASLGEASVTVIAKIQTVITLTVTPQ